MLGTVDLNPVQPGRSQHTDQLIQVRRVQLQRSRVGEADRAALAVDQRNRLVCGQTASWNECGHAVGEVSVKRLCAAGDDTGRDERVCDVGSGDDSGCSGRDLVIGDLDAQPTKPLDHPTGAVDAGGFQLRKARDNGIRRQPGEVADQMHLVRIQARGQLHPADDANAETGTGGPGCDKRVGRVVVRDRERFNTGRRGQFDQRLGAEEPIRTVGVRVQVNGPCRSPHRLGNVP